MNLEEKQNKLKKLKRWAIANAIATPVLFNLARFPEVGIIFGGWGVITLAAAIILTGLALSLYSELG